ncbi:MAG: DNA repair protein RecN [Longimicrobiales bacterium]
MLTELRIQDFAVIDRLAIRLGPGLNALTGETGAGKSIIVGALSLILGERATADVVRAGADRAIVEAVFDVTGMEPVLRLLSEHGIEPEDGLVIIRREIGAAGRGRVWVNGAASTVSLLGELGAHLVDLHGQHEHQSLLHAAQQRALLDAYADAVDLARVVRGEHERLRGARARIADLDSRVRTAEQRSDFLRFQLDEIEKAKVTAGEEEQLETEANRLSHAGELATLAESLHTELYAGERAIAARLAEVRRTLEHLTRIDATLHQWRETVETSLYGLEEMGREMGEYSSSIEHDPARLDDLRRRQDLLFRLKRKYGPELVDVIQTARTARAELDALESSVLDRAAIEREIAEAQGALDAAAARLTAARRKGAKRFAAAIAAGLPDLGMAGAQFRIDLVQLPQAGANGAEDVEFLIAVNAGFDPKPLARVASGGEMSRIMLALKTELARVDGIPTLVFDEIDAGIGGRVANQVGEKLKQVAENHQVFVITHLPQIASRATTHLLVQKTDRRGITAADVQPLTGTERVRELARLLGGDPESEVSIEHARELLSAPSQAR